MSWTTKALRALGLVSLMRDAFSWFDGRLLNTQGGQAIMVAFGIYSTLALRFSIRYFVKESIRLHSDDKYPYDPLNQAHRTEADTKHLS